MKRKRNIEDENVSPKSFWGHPTPFGEIKACCFFKLIVSPTSQSKKLRIPEMFTRRYGDKITTASVLKVPTGETWEVALLEEDNNKLWFHDGWHDFVEYYSIEYGFFLLFRYEGNSNFSVNVFDRTACEISYQCSNTLNTSSSLNPKSSNLEVIQLDSDDEEEETDDEIDDANESVPFEFPNWLKIYKGLIKAAVAAGISLSGRPFFVSKIKPYALSGGMYLNVPVPFARNHLRCMTVEYKFVKLEANGGRQWTVKCIRNNRSKFTLGSGWIIFAREVGLEVGDVCVFEVSDAKKDLLQVHVAKSSKIIAADVHI